MAVQQPEKKQAPPVLPEELKLANGSGLVAAAIVLSRKFASAANGYATRNFSPEIPSQSKLQEAECRLSEFPITYADKTAV